MRLHRINWTIMLVVGLAVPQTAAAADVPVGRFVDVKPVPGLDSTFRDQTPSISKNGLSLYFSSDRPWTGGIDPDQMNIWRATRPSIFDAFGDPERLGENVNTDAVADCCPETLDEMTLYYSSERERGNGRGDIWVSTRDSLLSPFGTPENLGDGVNTEDTEFSSTMTENGLMLFFTRRGEDDESADLYQATRLNTIDQFSMAENLGEVNGPNRDANPTVSSDGLTIVFDSTRSGGGQFQDLWVTTRETAMETFGSPVLLEDFSLGSDIGASVYVDFTPFLSPDWPAIGSKLYFARSPSNRFDDWDLYEATWVPEPSTIVLSLVSFACLLAWRRKKPSVV